MCKVIERERSPESSTAKCAHPLALDKFDGKFGLHLRRLSCLMCSRGWWESDGVVIGSTSALRVVAKLAEAEGPRPTGWATADREWRRLEEESLTPVR
jgi:hypothetical protein